MKRTRQFYLKLAAGTILAGCMLCISAWVISDFDIHNLANSSPFEQKEYNKKINDIKSIQIDTEYNEIQISPSEDDNIHITYYENERNTYDIQDSASTFLMKKKDRPFYEHLISIGTNDEPQTIILKIPASYQNDILIDTTYGDIKLQDFKKLSDISLTTTYSSVDVNNIEQINSLITNSMHGNISLNQISARDRISIDTSYGAVGLKNVKTETDLTISTTHDAISLQKISAKGELYADTTYGDIDILTSYAGTTVLNSTHGKFEFKDRYETASLNANTTYESIVFKTLKADQIKLVTTHGAISGSILGEQNDYHIETDIYDGNTTVTDAAGNTNRSLYVSTSYDDCNIQFVPNSK